jgi:hypothetical protein
MGPLQGIQFVGLGGFHPHLPVIQGVWVVVLGIGFTAAYWQWQDIRSGRCNLVLDESAGWLELPRAERRGPGRRVPLTAAKRVFLGGTGMCPDKSMKPILARAPQ